MNKNTTLNKTKKIKKNKTRITIILWLVIFFCISIFPAQSQTRQIEVVLNWSSNAYVPLNYQGKALPTKGSAIEIVAQIIPKAITVDNLNFLWFLDGNLQKTASGLGKDVFKFISQKTIGYTYSIRLEVLDQENNIMTSDYQEIKLMEPQIVLETKIPPLDSSSLKKYRINANQRVNFIAQPYFFNIKNLNSLEYFWKLGLKTASEINSDNSNIFTLTVGQIAETIKQNLQVWAQNKNQSYEKTQATAEIFLTP